MSRLPLAALLLALPAVAATPTVAHAQVVTVAGTPDSVAMDAALARARRQATDGDLAGARLVLDSLARVAPPGSRRLAETLFWRATYAQTASGAERDYRRIVIEHPLSPRTEDALMRLAQLELARGDQQMAVRHLERLVLEHPESPNRARARYWTARAWMDAGEVAKGCAALGEALVSSGGTDVELRNQVRYAGQRCPKGWDASAATATAAVATSAAASPTPTSAESTSVARADSGRAVTAAAEPPRQGIASAPKESVTTPPPAPSVARTSAPASASMPPFLGASPTAPPTASTTTPPSTTTTAASTTASPRTDTSAGRGAPPNTNIAPPPKASVTTSAPAASPARPGVFVPPLANVPKGVGSSAVAGAASRPPVSAPASTPAATPSAAPSTTPSTTTPASTPTRASTTTSANPSVSTAAPAAAPAAARPSAPAPVPASTPARSTTTTRGTVYTVQLAAYDTRADAESLVRRLTSRGLDARVSGDVAPFRVRVGRFATRAEASRQLAALKAKGQGGWVAEEQGN